MENQMGINNVKEDILKGEWNYNYNDNNKGLLKNGPTFYDFNSMIVYDLFKNVNNFRLRIEFNKEDFDKLFIENTLNKDVKSNVTLYDYLNTNSSFPEWECVGHYHNWDLENKHSQSVPHKPKGFLYNLSIVAEIDFSQIQELIKAIKETFKV